jgi:asparagine synthase (glutamine-hydrolysing)
MCGIAGVVSSGRLTSGQSTWLHEATRSLERRGPDGEGIETIDDDGVAFGHRRLSIIDLSSGGYQPMRSRSRRFVLTYNGEIYNYRALRSELISRGISFQSDSDTEVMLAAFEEYGIHEALNRFDGMFAFGLFDTLTKELHLGRDRFGEKPLVYAVVAGSLIFASEVRQLRAYSGFDSTIDVDAACSVLDVGYVRQDRTIYVGAQRVAPGEFLTWVPATKALNLTRYWDPLRQAIKQTALANRCPVDIDEVSGVLKASVASRMQSDVPLGVFLSGGIDSSLVAALAQESSSQPIKTYTIGLEDERRSEANEAQAVARHLGTDHHTLIATEKDALDVVPLIASMYDEPFADSSQIPTHLVSKLARSHITVALTGDGGDEIFGGYNRHMLGVRLDHHFGRPQASLARFAALGVERIPASAVRAAFNAVTRVGPLRSYKGDPVDALSKATRLGKCHDGFELYSQMVLTGSAIGRAGRGLDRTKAVWANDHLRLAEQMMLADTASYLPGDILTKVDRASMFVGLETRAPFLSPDVFDMAWSAPLGDRLTASKGKMLLRQVLAQHVPETLWDRPKTGFGVPINEWLVGPLSGWVNDMLSEMPVRLGPEASASVAELWKHQPANWQHAVWNGVCLTAWLSEVGSEVLA